MRSLSRPICWPSTPPLSQPAPALPVWAQEPKRLAQRSVTEAGVTAMGSDDAIRKSEVSWQIAKRWQEIAEQAGRAGEAVEAIVAASR